MLAGISEILVITRPEDLAQFQLLLGDGSRFGIQIEYKVQQKASGIAEAFLIGESFIGDNSVCLILGDNIFHGSGLGRQLMDFTNPSGAHIFAYQVRNPSDYGVVEFDSTGIAISIEEKPDKPKSNQAVVGVYIYDDTVMEKITTLQPSARGEYEVTDLNNLYIQDGKCKNVTIEGWWIDAGTPDRIIELEKKLT